MHLFFGWEEGRRVDNRFRGAYGVVRAAWLRILSVSTGVAVVVAVATVIVRTRAVLGVGASKA